MIVSTLGFGRSSAYDHSSEFRMKIVWTARAEQRVREALEVERRERGAAAQRWLQRLMQRVDLLQHEVMRGFIVPELDRAEVAQVPYESHRIIYRREAGRIVVLTIVSARKEANNRQRDRHHDGERASHGECDLRANSLNRAQVDIQS